MDDPELTRKAIEEIVREMHKTKEREQRVPPEQKKNPLGKPNKLFLGRTLNSMLTHNKRESDRTQKRCLSKLQELNNRQRHEEKEFRRTRCSRTRAKRNKHSEGLREVSGNRSRSSRSSSSSRSNSCNSAAERKSCRKGRHKKQKKKKRPKSVDCGNRIDDDSNSNSEENQRSKCKYKDLVNKVSVEKYPTSSETGEPITDHCVDQNVANNFVYTALAYTQIGQLLYGQQLWNAATSSSLSGALNGYKRTNELAKESSSSLSDSVGGSSLEEYENGILTFGVSSSDSSSSGSIQSISAKDRIRRKCNIRGKETESDVDDEISILSCSSVDSAERIDRLRETKYETVILSSSSESVNTNGEKQREKKNGCDAGIDTVCKVVDDTVILNCSEALDVDATELSKSENNCGSVIDLTND